MFYGPVTVARCISRPESNLSPCNTGGAFESSPANDHSWYVPVPEGTGTRNRLATANGFHMAGLSPAPFI